MYWNRIRKWPLLIIIAFAVICFGFFQIFYPYHFFFKGQNQLFLMSWQYVGTLLDKPAWVACAAGEFFTQFYYYDWASMILAAGVALRETSCHLFYGYTLSSTIALIGGLVVFLLLQEMLKQKWYWALAAILPGAVLCYWMFGYGVWVFLLLAAITVWKVAVPVALGFACLLPAVRGYYNLTFTDLCQYPGIEKMHVPDFNKETDLHMIHSYQTGNWDDVIKTAKADPVLNSMTVNGQPMKLNMEQSVSSTIRRFIYNLVQAQNGTLPDALLDYYPNYLGTFTSMIGTNIPPLMFMNLNEFYYAIGDIARAERGAFMACVSVPTNKNAYTIKRLAECALIRNDEKAAKKFLKLLRQSIPYRDWADSAGNDERYKQKANFVNLQDSISPSEESHYILTQLVKSNPENLVALDYMLCSDLQKKDIDAFKHDYDTFCTEKPRIKKLYQEALCIWLMKQQASEEEWQKYIKDQQVRSRLKDYMAESRSPRFADTYWFYFDVFNLEGN